MTSDVLEMPFHFAKVKRFPFSILFSLSIDNTQSESWFFFDVDNGHRLK